MIHPYLGYPVVEVVEGGVRLIVPAESLKSSVPRKTPVFYNPMMARSRDVGVLFIKAYRDLPMEGLSVCDALAGSGVRGLRYLIESSRVEHLVSNDISREAVKLISINAEINGVSNKVTVENRDANSLLADYASRGERFYIVDIDPFGSPAVYMHNAVMAVHGGGILAATATDTAPTSGVYPRTCLRRYGARSLKTEFYHEVGLRILVGYIARVGLTYDLGLENLLAYREIHYFRCYMKVEPGVHRAEKTLDNIGFIMYCRMCMYRRSVSLIDVTEYNSLSSAVCPLCNSILSFIGPLWIGMLAEPNLCASMMEEAERTSITDRRYAKKLLSFLVCEASMPPTYYTVDQIASKLKVKTPSLEKVKDIICGEGYEFSRTHFDPKGFKTDMESSDLIEALRRRLQ
ncbi:MAG: tRNA (guanine(10)-N(2))-dimethyltransferase [Candidatus Bathyarchaeia archaeon]